MRERLTGPPVFRQIARILVAGIREVRDTARRRSQRQEATLRFAESGSLDSERRYGRKIIFTG